MTPSLLCGNWEVEHALFDRISNTVSSRLVHFMIILVVFFAVDGDIARSLCINFQVSHGNGHLDQDSRPCMFARLIVVRDPTGSDFDNKLLWVSVASFVSIPKVF